MSWNIEKEAKIFIYKKYYQSIAEMRFLRSIGNVTRRNTVRNIDIRAKTKG